MRGGKFSQGTTFQGERMKPSDWTNTRLFQSSLAVSFQPADVYNFWNKRETIQGSLIAQRPSPSLFVPHKTSFPHIARRGAGGWGHVPSTDRALIENSQNLEKLREGVKQKC